MPVTRIHTPCTSAEDLSRGGSTAMPVRSLRRHRSYQSLTSHPSFNNSSKRHTGHSRPPIPEFHAASYQNGGSIAADMPASKPEPSTLATRTSTGRLKRGSGAGTSMTSTTATAPTTATTAKSSRPGTSGRANGGVRTVRPNDPLTFLAARPPRSRSNSDTAANASPSASLKRMSNSRKSLPFVARRTSLDVLLREGPGKEKQELDRALAELRYMILTTGLDADSDGMSPNRIYVWLILLNVPPISTDEYLNLVHRGRSPAYTKIRNDTFRTLVTDPLFKRRVTEASLIRLLNATAWKIQDLKNIEKARTQKKQQQKQRLRQQQRSPPPPGTSSGSLNDMSLLSRAASPLEFSSPEAAIYVQGMNVLSAPFLYTSRSEVEAYALFTYFITHECPGYIRGAMDGVHKGLKLMDRCLEIVDPNLASHLFSKGLYAELYAFPSMVTMCACTPPLPEVLHLWDFLFAYGPHLNVLCIVAQLLRMRDILLASESPNKLLRSFPSLNAREIVTLTVVIVQKIPDSLYAELVDHAK